MIYEKGGIPDHNVDVHVPEATDPRFVDTGWVYKPDKTTWVHALAHQQPDHYRPHGYDRLTVRKDWIMAERGDRHMLIAVVDDSALS